MDRARRSFDYDPLAYCRVTTYDPLRYDLSPDGQDNWESGIGAPQAPVRRDRGWYKK